NPTATKLSLSMPPDGCALHTRSVHCSCPGDPRARRSFPTRRSSDLAAALVELDPGAMRELHWHPNNDEWQYWISGQGRMTVFASGGKARTFDYQAGDVGYVPFAMGHYVENIGDERVTFLELIGSDYYADCSLNQS